VVSDERLQLQEILNNLASVLIMSGCSAEDLAQEFATVCRQLKGRRPTESMRSSSKIDHAQIISHWYRDPDYLDAVGKPRRLAFAGAQPSLTGLISRVLPGASPRVILDSLLELRAVRLSGGRYEPTGIHVRFDRNRAHWTYWNMKALRDVLQSMVHNYTCRPEQQYLAKAARHPRLPVSELPAFHARIERRAFRFLNDIDASMQRLERSSSQEQTTEMGVLVFAFENPVRSQATGSTTSVRVRRKSPRVVASD
jgi:hypothetical protein